MGVEDEIARKRAEIAEKDFETAATIGPGGDVDLTITLTRNEWANLISGAFAASTLLESAAPLTASEIRIAIAQAERQIS